MGAAETRETLERFYGALGRRDGEAMAAMYAPDATFEDEVFRLQGADIGRMWIGLLKRAKDFSVTYAIAQADDARGTVDLTARYLFGGRRPVVNVIRAKLELANGKIQRHVDQFDFPRWAGQALGAWAGPLARFSWFRRRVSRRAARGLGLPPKP